MPEYVLNSGVDFILWLQGLGDWLTTPMRFFTFLGTEEFYLLVMPALYWCVDAALGIRLGVILLFSGSFNSALKLVLHDPRPFWVDTRLAAYSMENSFGIPSGHAQNAVAIWGLLAAALRKTWGWILTVGLILMIGISRMYLAVHFPTDVLAGWFVGLVVLVAFLVLEPEVRAWLFGVSLPTRLAATLGLSLAVILLGVLARSRLSTTGWQLPQTWVMNAGAAFPDSEPIEPRSLGGVITGAAALFGFGAGVAWLEPRGGFAAGGPWHKRFLRYLMGLVGVILIWAGLGAVFPGGETTLAYSLRFVRYALVGLWIAGLAPALFIRLKLAASQS